MRPTLATGDWAIATVAERVRPGDVVVIEHPERPGFEMVKRVLRVSNDGLWVQGDDPSTSTDSRAFGAVPADLIRGRVRLVWWPPSRVRVL